MRRSAFDVTSSDLRWAHRGAAQLRPQLHHKGALKLRIISGALNMFSKKSPRKKQNDITKNKKLIPPHYSIIESHLGQLRAVDVATSLLHEEEGGPWRTATIAPVVLVPRQLCRGAKKCPSPQIFLGRIHADSNTWIIISSANRDLHDNNIIKNQNVPFQLNFTSSYNFKYFSTHMIFVFAFPQRFNH